MNDQDYTTTGMARAANAPSESDIVDSGRSRKRNNDEGSESDGAAAVPSENDGEHDESQSRFRCQRARPNHRRIRGRRRGMTTDEELSRTLSWVLRHTAPSLGLRMSSDGYIAVNDLLQCNHPRFRNKTSGQPLYTVEDVQRVVASNSKQRYTLRENQNVLYIRANQGHSIPNVSTLDLLTRVETNELACMGDFTAGLGSTAAETGAVIVHGTTRHCWREFIHTQGLNRMTRNHIHFAPGLNAHQWARLGESLRPRGIAAAAAATGEAPNRIISGIRQDSQVWIFVNGAQCAQDGIPFYRSDNGVLLCAGKDEEEGVLPPEYFLLVVDAVYGNVLLDQRSPSQTNATNVPSVEMIDSTTIAANGEAEAMAETNE